MSNAYEEEFKTEVIERFCGYFSASATISAAARGAAEDFGVSATTVLKWAEQAGQMPTPTWGEIRRLKAANNHLHQIAAARADRIAELEALLAEAGSRP